MAKYQDPGTTITDGMAAAAALTGIPLDDLAGFVILAVGHNDTTAMVHNCGSKQLLMSVLLSQAQYVNDCIDDTGQAVT